MASLRWLSSSNSILNLPDHMMEFTIVVLRIPGLKVRWSIRGAVRSDLYQHPQDVVWDYESLSGSKRLHDSTERGSILDPYREKGYRINRPAVLIFHSSKF